MGIAGDEDAQAIDIRQTPGAIDIRGGSAALLGQDQTDAQTEPEPRHTDLVEQSEAEDDAESDPEPGSPAFTIRATQSDAVPHRKSSIAFME